MKKLLLLAVILLIPHFQNAMEEKLTPEKAESLWWKSARAYDVHAMPYEEYRTNMMKAIPLVKDKQAHFHNPFLSAIHEGDYEFTKFLLDQGLSPVFRSANSIDAFDALRLRNGKVFYNPDAYKMFKALLNEYLNGQQHTPFPFADWYEEYVTDRELRARGLDWMI